MRTSMLAGLIGQAQRSGADLATLRALVEEASELGAGRALARIGLGDERAGDDLREVRQLLGAWRDAKKAARKAAIGWLVRVGLALLVAGLAVKLGLGALLDGGA